MRVGQARLLALVVAVFSLIVASLLALIPLREPITSDSCGSVARPVDIDLTGLGRIDIDELHERQEAIRTAEDARAFEEYYGELLQPDPRFEDAFVVEIVANNNCEDRRGSRARAAGGAVALALVAVLVGWLSGRRGQRPGDDSGVSRRTA